jgi:hypothetical protein
MEASWAYQDKKDPEKTNPEHRFPWDFRFIDRMGADESRKVAIR